ncbi:PD40 domain-containing protein [Bacillus sp. APMAM]|nr:PD40 domain-containing protein [Bacillus sp. APMAM]RTZ55015.1 hypothetical protein EKO25_14955 [Bacillus sp. SAJ1]
MIVNNELSLILNNKIKKSQNKIQKTTSSISSGKRINSAADDAAGLAISQKIRALAKGNQQAIRNVQDASSLVQVADGAMQEIKDMLQRMRELTVQAMNGTNTQVTEQAITLTNADTVMIQKEIDEIKKNINDIVHNTEFNTKKVLTNVIPGDYLYETRSASKNITLSTTSQTNSLDSSMNHVGYNKIPQVIQQSSTISSIKPSTYVNTIPPQSYIGSTVTDHLPRWSEDGQTVIFSSTRDGGQYIVPVDGRADPVINNNVKTSSQQTLSNDGLMRLSSSGSTLYLEWRSSTLSSSWYRVQMFENYNENDNLNGYSFSPLEDASGNTAFVYSDNEGNIKRVNVNTHTRTVNAVVSIIPTTDILNIPPVNNTITLPTIPDLYRMNTVNASLKIQKVNDNGTRDISYWDGTGAPPAGGYYTISGGSVTFFGDAIIGSESVDDAQDYYTFSYVSDQSQNNVFSTSIPSGAEVYNMHGEDGPRSLKISVGGTVISKDQLLASRPSDVEGTNGVYVDETTGKIEFYGDLRPSYKESVSIEYMNDADSRNQVQSFSISSYIDTYNLNDPDLKYNRPLRVYVGGKEIAYDDTKTNGYTYENGRINLYGNARPDISGNPTVEIKYVYDYSNTSKDVYGIQLSYSPEIYNLGSTTSPNSIRVFRNQTEVIAYSNVDGFQYNAATNTIELYGKSRPDVNDTYSIQMIVPTGDTQRMDGKVEIPLTLTPETYGDPNPITFKVLVDGREVSYDSNKTNGYYYNNATNRIELYGDARPEAKNNSNPDVEVYYVYESPSVMVGNDSYDFQLASKTSDYGVADLSNPRAIRVYQNGTEVPYDSINGFTYDSESHRLSLNGIYRPNKDNGTGEFLLYSITSDDLKATVPEGSYIYKVIMNGEEIQKAQSDSGDGYTYNGQQIEIIGNSRPDVSKNMSSISLNIQYFDSLEIALNDSTPNSYNHGYCEHEAGEGIMGSEIDSTNLAVYIDGNQLSEEQFSLQGNKIVLLQDKITLNAGTHALSVNYQVRQAIGYEPNEFIFQVGANAGQNYNVSITSFDNMLRDTNVICVRNYEDATKGLAVIDRALDFVLRGLSNIGAVENRLDHMATNLSNMEENTTAALSKIEDADMAKQMMSLTKEQILAQVQETLASQLKQSREQIIELLK